MALGPIEVLVVAFPGNRFNGQILPELERLVGNDTITIIDAVLLTKDTDSEVNFIDYDEIGGDDEAAPLAEMMNEFNDLLSEDDIDELAAGIEPGSSAAVIVFEHTWVRPLRQALSDCGAVPAVQFRVPAAVVDEVLENLTPAG